MTLIWDINGPDAKQLRDEVDRNRIYPTPDCKFGSVPPCSCSVLSVGEGSNLSHIKEPYWYEYKFDAKVKVKCDNGEKNMTCNFRIKVNTRGIKQYDNSGCRNLPRIGSLKK